ncbi:hypothetical protein N7517_003692 [Penicillium concentricum]|uniref:Uncharacterized protein n=1 Tax=Penicillium concentricum TaxID=293559 RepID=A0A9W9S464_9EURO|nr:uncharacterized protein N7517_003692 [Penicillium concentricum]KAJ5371686.1 hypothetical protein N7517_003692 [Penicillium concentricum]
MCQRIMIAPEDDGGAKLEASEFASLVPTLAGPSNWIQWRNHFKPVYLLATMDPEPASHIVNIALAKDIWSAMNDFYRSENATANVCHQWRRWTSLRFRCALDDLRELKIEVPPSVVLALQRPRATVST